tara:strand:- start:11767 stop:12201 length:435 start_codon:yes stop_codon:yes gene_type:complete
MKIKDLTEGPELDRLKSIPGSIAGYFADLNKTFNKKSGFAGVSPPGTAQDRGPTGMGAIRGKGGKIVTPKEKPVKQKPVKAKREPSITKPDQLAKGSGYSEGGEVWTWDGQNWNSQSGKQIGSAEGWKKFQKAQGKGQAFLGSK